MSDKENDIIKDLTACDPYYEGILGDLWCIFCGRDHTEAHKKSCIYRRAKEVSKHLDRLNCERREF